MTASPCTSLGEVRFDKFFKPTIPNRLIEALPTHIDLVVSLPRC